MQCRIAYFLYIGAIFASTASAFDLIFLSQERSVLTEALLEDNGTEIDFDQTRFSSTEVGPFDVTAHSGVMQNGLGAASSDAEQFSVIDQTGIFAQSSISALVSTSRNQAFALAGARGVIDMEFTVSETMEFELTASIFWVDAPVLVAVNFREIGGSRFLWIQNDGADGSASQSMTISLEPGVRYELQAIATGFVTAEGTDASDGMAGGYSVSFTPIPSPSGVAVLFVGMLGLQRRRR